MRRADRLFELIHLLRRARKAITAVQLAEALEVAPRTIYRDVAALIAMRVPIDGSAGVGYIMRPGYDLSPLMFDREEIEAVAVGLQLLNRTGDQDLQAAARRVAAKIAGVLPELRADELDDGRFVVSGFGTPAVADMGMLRSAVRDNRRLALVYRDERERLTERTCLPLAVIYYIEVTVLAAWCGETKQSDILHHITRNTQPSSLSSLRIYNSLRDNARERCIAENDTMSFRCR